MRKDGTRARRIRGVCTASVSAKSVADADVRFGRGASPHRDCAAERTADRFPSAAGSEVQAGEHARSSAADPFADPRRPEKNNPFAETVIASSKSGHNVGSTDTEKLAFTWISLVADLNEQTTPEAPEMARKRALALIS